MNIFSKTVILIVLVISGIGKIINPLPAMELMQLLPLFPNFMILPTISIMPILELAIALAIIFRYKKVITYSINLGLFFGFFCISLYATILKINSDCGCFGSLLESPVGWTMVIRNSFFLILSLYLLIKNSDYKLVTKKECTDVKNA